MSTADQTITDQATTEEVVPSQTAPQSAARQHQPTWSDKPLWFKCSYTDFTRLRDINRVIGIAERKWAAWQRWARKAPHNRVHRTYRRNDSGQRCGVESTRTAGEPSFCTILPLQNCTINDLGMRKLYQSCRMPSETPVEGLTQQEQETIASFHMTLGMWERQL